MYKILIIEDEKNLAEMYRNKLAQAEFEVILVEDTKKGLISAKKEKPDLILLDILLPKENGISFLTKLRNDPEIAATSVIAFSNYDDPETKKQAYKLGIKEYLLKTNYTPQEIVEKIKKLFENE